MSDEKILTAIATLDGSINALRADFAVAITDIRADVADIRSDAGDIRSDIADIRAVVTNARSDIADVRAEVTNVHSDVADLRAVVTNVHSDVADIRADVTTARSDFGAAITGLREEVTGQITKFRVETMDRFDRMEERFTQTRDDMSVNMAAVDTMRKSHESIRGELNSIHEIISILTRKQRRLEAQVHDLTKPPDLA